MSKTKTPQPYPDRGGSFVLDEGSMTLTPVRNGVDPLPESPVQTPVETGREPTTEQEPQ